MTTTIIKNWGNSLAIRIPKSVLNKIHLKQGDELEFKFKDGNIILLPTKTMSLESLLADVNEDNLHHESNWGKKGGEEW